MHSNRIWRWGALLTVLAVFGAASAWFSWLENNSCMGVQMLSQQKEKSLGEYVYKDLSGYLFFNGEPAAVDVTTSTVYLSQEITRFSRPEELPGTLKVTHNGYSLRFAADEWFRDLATAVKDGHSFRLLAISSKGTYMEYQVVFTTLPVMRLDGVFSHMNPEWREVMLGDVCLWTPKDPATGRYSVKTSVTEWHVRGGGTANMEKNPWKLALEKENGENNNVDFLGLGADDDWILNPMIIDDTKVKENLFMHLWNDWAAQVPWNHPMSVGEYVELILDQSYMGVYLLQRRIDPKYLQLQQEDILLKGGWSYTPASVEDAYVIVSSSLTAEETLSLMEGVFTGRDVSSVNLDNFLDVNLFLNYASTDDNWSYKNMYYLLEKKEEGYHWSLLPWDTDQTWGVLWGAEGVAFYGYNYDMSMAKVIKRREYDAVKACVPELDRLMAQRWQQLRKNILSEEHILFTIDTIVEQLQYSGVMHREWEERTPVFGGRDTLENLYRFLQERIVKLDRFYDGYL